MEAVSEGHVTAWEGQDIQGAMSESCEACHDETTDSGPNGHKGYGILPFGQHGVGAKVQYFFNE